jgi:hypothetical protein
VTLQDPNQFVVEGDKGQLSQQYTSIVNNIVVPENVLLVSIEDEEHTITQRKTTRDYSFNPSQKMFTYAGPGQISPFTKQPQDTITLLENSNGSTSNNATALSKKRLEAGQINSILLQVQNPKPKEWKNLNLSFKNEADDHRRNQAYAALNQSLNLSYPS